MYLSDSQLLTLCGAAFAVGRRRQKPEDTLQDIPVLNSINPFHSDDLGVNYDACFVAETDQEVILSFKGTSLPQDYLLKIIWDWKNNFNRTLIPYPNIDGYIHQGFGSSITKLKHKGCLDEVSQRMESGKSLVITGYSKGGALSSLAALLLVNEYHIPAKLVRICTFAAPKSGDRTFAEAFTSLFSQSSIQRYEYLNDLIPYYPFSEHFQQEVIDKMPTLFKDIFQRRNCSDSSLYIPGSDRYQHVGTLRFIQACELFTYQDESLNTQLKCYEEIREHPLAPTFTGRRLKRFAQEVEALRLEGKFISAVLRNHGPKPYQAVLRKQCQCLG